MTTAEILVAATPRPWSSTPKDLGRYWVRGNGRNLNGKPPHSPIAQTKVTPYSEEANAAYIVLAVNAYERDQRVIKALSEALQDAHDLIMDGEHVKEPLEIMAAAREAIALANGTNVNTSQCDECYCTHGTHLMHCTLALAKETQP